MLEEFGDASEQVGAEDVAGLLDIIAILCGVLGKTLADPDTRW